jgi:hypothetical protein
MPPANKTKKEGPAHVRLKTFQRAVSALVRGSSGAPKLEVFALGLTFPGIRNIQRGARHELELF